MRQRTCEECCAREVYGANRPRCFICQVRRYLAIGRDLGDEAVVHEAIIMEGMNRSRVDYVDRDSNNTKESEA